MPAKILGKDAPAVDRFGGARGSGWAGFYHAPVLSYSRTREQAQPKSSLSHAPPLANVILGVLTAHYRLHTMFLKQIFMSYKTGTHIVFIAGRAEPK